jgi:hypothetical protein
LLLARQASSRLLVARGLVELGCLARREGNLPLAKERLEEAFSLLEGTPWRLNAAQCGTLLSEVAEESGDEGMARSWRQEARMLDPGGGRDRWVD